MELSKATKQWNLQGPPNNGTFKGHQTMEPSRATKQWNFQGPPNDGTF